MTHGETVNSGTRRGGLVIACSNSGDPVQQQIIHLLVVQIIVEVVIKL